MVQSSVSNDRVECCVCLTAGQLIAIHCFLLRRRVDGRLDPKYPYVCLEAEIDERKR